MRDSRGEWHGRDKWSREHYEFTRNSGLRRSDFGEKEKVSWSDRGDKVVFVFCLVVAVWLLIGGV